ncbi:ribonuclease HII [Jannaschia sp. CCS1]|uniref:Ribonuclease HII n=1 Tax=Jannaschia sp. (strain CCS1) TaxID=290400 RepID=RNH2_JANSC|nr:ribonuclease HII [Jannaschia sp. CCS1]Q28VF4.1 RecName: Full=Ribonuclease HII; Short=RNase HII [Jannaschia sp. CCS1]ABD53308.1 RNase HII [Jannaschia sp. CCS1]
MGPDFEIERELGGLVAGVDEVGRGPWAGPVTACAVVLDPMQVPDGLNDSKKLSEARRDALAMQILRVADVSLGWASVEEIDALNIRQATFLAMRRAMDGLTTPPTHALIDGNAIPPGLSCPATCVVKGDGRSVSIAAASIVAKVRRDALMKELAVMHPGYGWETNMGYGTAKHAAGLHHLGVTQYHRRSFAPIAKILCG